MPNYTVAPGHRVALEDGRIYEEGEEVSLTPEAAGLLSMHLDEPAAAKAKGKGWTADDTGDAKV